MGALHRHIMMGQRHIKQHK